MNKAYMIRNKDTGMYSHVDGLELMWEEEKGHIFEDVKDAVSGAKAMCAVEPNLNLQVISFYLVEAYIERSI
jgi:hypothetical protein